MYRKKDTLAIWIGVEIKCKFIRTYAFDQCRFHRLKEPFFMTTYMGYRILLQRLPPCFVATHCAAPTLVDSSRAQCPIYCAHHIWHMGRRNFSWKIVRCVPGYCSRAFPDDIYLQGNRLVKVRNRSSYSVGGEYAPVAP